MGRPTLPDSERHERHFRVRLRADQAALLIQLAKYADVPPAVLLRSIIIKQLPVLKALREAHKLSQVDQV